MTAGLLPRYRREGAPVRLLCFVGHGPEDRPAAARRLTRALAGPRTLLLAERMCRAFSGDPAGAIDFDCQ